jgi:S-DNA-T family DNA segregation ATPase FtsK/SpoIIIE
MAASWRPIGGVIPAGGLFGSILADYLLASMNVTGAALFTAACWIISIYLVSKFEMARVPVWFRGPISWVRSILSTISGVWREWRKKRALLAREKAQKRAARKALEEQLVIETKVTQAKPAKQRSEAPPIVDPMPDARIPPFDPDPDVEDIPIHSLEMTPQPPGPIEIPPAAPPTLHDRYEHIAPVKARADFKLPSTELLQEPPARSVYDSQELKEIAGRIKSKFEEFNVHGSVTQINPGPVVTTFEFKPEAGVKYSRITTLTEDLCLGLQAESILIERIPGKPTVGIEVPNSKREVISLRQILESDEFRDSGSPLSIALGKDINGRIKVTALDTMPHLLIAGSTGAGKSVMLNSLIMSILYKATPRQVRMIMVDPKRLEFGPYEGIPHLLTPVITDSKKATYALKNAVLEMERRLKLLASQGVRNIEQYNKKVRQMEAQPRSLFEEESGEEPLEQIPYVLIVIDELADLMMLERAGVEESVTRLAQMARAVGMHLVLATQRPSVDVITGLIKANFPSRISFRVATRVDSRTVLDVMGAEHLLGKGDMLFLPPGSSRLTRVHGAFVSEAETARVVDFWKEQAEPEYDKSFLIAPPADDESENEEFDGPEDPAYQDAVRVVCEMGKASTSTLQRRLRLGYGRAARILDMMQRDGIIGPPDGSRPRDVLKRPDWLEEIENQLR